MRFMIGSYLKFETDAFVVQQSALFSPRLTWRDDLINYIYAGRAS